MWSAGERLGMMRQRCKARDNEEECAEDRRAFAMKASTLALLIAMLACAPALAVSPQAEGFKKLSTSQIRQAFSGKTFSDDTHFSNRYRADGSIEGVSMGKKVSNKWKIVKETLCITDKFGELSEASVSLDEALKASEREGRPLSAKYEIENGAFQLSVYVAKGNGFAEVIIDHKGGSIKKTEPITEADDLEQAKEQQQRLAHARIPLDRAVTDAVKDNSGYRAVEIEPTVDRAGKPVASVTLMKGDEVKKVVEPLE